MNFLCYTRRLRAFCRTIQRVSFMSLTKQLLLWSHSESEPERAIIMAWTRPEARRAIYEQGEFTVKGKGGPNPPAVQYWGMTCE